MPHSLKSCATSYSDLLVQPNITRLLAAMRDDRNRY
jgi:hypothetical protein